jgi:hypothetical protein
VFIRVHPRFNFGVRVEPELAPKPEWRQASLPDVEGGILPPGSNAALRKPAGDFLSA